MSDIQIDKPFGVWWKLRNNMGEFTSMFSEKSQADALRENAISDDIVMAVAEFTVTPEQLEIKK